MNVLLPIVANPFIDPLYPFKCKLASIDYACEGVDKNECCTVYHSVGIARKNETGLCSFKAVRKPVETKKGKKVNPLKESKRKSAEA